MKITDPAGVPTSFYPFVMDFHQFYELMMALGEGRSSMTSSDAETDSKPIIIIIIIILGTIRNHVRTIKNHVILIYGS